MSLTRILVLIKLFLDMVLHFGVVLWEKLAGRNVHRSPKNGTAVAKTPQA